MEKDLAIIFHVTTDYVLRLEWRQTVDITGLSDEDVITVKMMISALRQKMKNKKRHWLYVTETQANGVFFILCLFFSG